MYVQSTDRVVERGDVHKNKANSSIYVKIYHERRKWTLCRRF